MNLEQIPIYPVLAELQACLAARVTDVCGTVLFVGDDISTKYGSCEECGPAYVRVSTAYPSANFPLPDEGPRSSILLAYSVFVGTVRCIPGYEDVEGPDGDDIAARGEQLLVDMHATLAAIRCCLEGKFEDVQYLVGAYTVLPDIEGTAAGEWALTIQQPF